MKEKNDNEVIDDEEKRKTVSQASKTIGLHSVDMKDLDRIRRTQNISDVEDLKIALAKEFFKLEMRMRKMTWMF